MNIGTLLGMALVLFPGGEPDWAEMANRNLPSSKTEITAEIKKQVYQNMRGNSVKLISERDLDSGEYNYTNYDEFIQAVYKLKVGNEALVKESMVDSLLGIITLDFRVGMGKDRIQCSLDMFSIDLWHPEGITATWHEGKDDKLGMVIKHKSPETIEFVNKFLSEPYVFNIKYNSKFGDFKYIGVLRDGKMVIYDRDNGRYDGIGGLIEKKITDFRLFSGIQQDWIGIAQKLVPSKEEIHFEVKVNDAALMGGDSVQVLYDLNPQKYSYTNNYEFTQALNKFRGCHYGAISDSMVDDVLPMVNLECKINEEAGNSFFLIPQDCPVYLWHPEGQAITWLSNKTYNKIGAGYKIISPKAIEFVNKFLDEPYVFLIEDGLLRAFKYIGIVRDGKLIVYDRDMNRYDGIEDMILKKFGSIENYLEVRSRPIIVKDLFGNEKAPVNQQQTR